jgi:hypothetical protein
MDYNYTYESDGGGLFAGVLLAVWLLIVIAIYVVTVIGLWKMYVKAGRPGWAAIIPIYNWWVWVEMIGKPRWWFWALVASVLLSWIPVVGIILSLLMFVLYLLGCLEMAKAFDRGSGTGIGLWLVPFVFAPILGFGDAQYVGVAAAPAGGYAAAPPPPPAGGYAAPAAPPAPPAAPVTPVQTPAPAAPVTPVTPAEAAPAAPVTPAEAAPASADAAADAPITPPEAPPAPSTPPSTSPPPPPPLA